MAPRTDPHPDIDVLIGEIADMAPLPVVAVRVLEIADGQQFSAHELSQAIAADQALTAKVLRLSNSAYYGFPRRITTVRDAVVLLGFRAVRSATLASCVIETVPGGKVLDAMQAWRYSMVVGLLAEVLARASKRHQDEAFTAGILHNIGRLALDQHRPRQLAEAKRIAEERALPAAEAEREVFGFTSSEVGGALALHWNFPSDLAAVVAGHQLDVDALPDPESLSAYVIRARMFARAASITDGFETPVKRQGPDVWDQPLVQKQMTQSGGMDGILDRVDAFLASADLKR
ncbi:MAG: HDOD domain-containing protein [Dehalococcoidia bacterium]|nr:MAG: HDOD domain-containing protein [Dehalococcoidia bacterium]